MSAVHLESKLVGPQKERCNKAFFKLLLWLAPVLIALLVILTQGKVSFEVIGYSVTTAQLVTFVVIFFGSGVIISFVAYWKHRTTLNEYQDMRTRIELAKQDSSITVVQELIHDATMRSEHNPLIKELIAQSLPSLKEHSFRLRRIRLGTQLSREVREFETNYDKRLAKIKRQTPIVKARANLSASLAFLKKRRKEISLQWEQAIESFSLWNKLKYAGTTPDFTEMDKVIKGMELARDRLETQHSDDFDALDKHIETLKTRAVFRVNKAKERAEEFILDNKNLEGFDSDLLKKSIWLSALSLPISIWSDADRAGDVYDALRGVNGNYAEMSNADIWWESLFMSSDSLVGLTSLVKGAYFEQLVAEDTGGQLFEHFNNPDTDIVIDGVAFQIKATDSVGYIESVAEGIPVISTSEVALSTGAIDSGFSNEEVTGAVELALGETVVDVGDTAVDAVLSGLGGLGVLATLEGINHAATKHKNGGDGVEAMFEGAGVAIEGTARALVGVAEMGYNVLASRPSRFIGRTILSGLKKLDDKLMEQSDKK